MGLSDREVGGFYWGSFRFAGTRLLLGCGSSRCAGLLDRDGEEVAFGGAPAERCYYSIEMGSRWEDSFGWGCYRCAAMLNGGREEAALGRAPAARYIGSKTCFWKSSRCAGLLDRGREEAASGGALAPVPLSSRCVGLLY